ncbi:hypothetical protein [Blastococcus sp. PRF04-17]|uniref:hypothetical protein n=1 Tax=Blastococcus sp. PRF04-17 TaxID=2933797 RepID=UPI001FF2E2E9|nr:hypothetical protein [Blastococcus sp. PRF04-17]UOY01874.1 hypothetical protein MVA48_00335 [Blastococcus sp. PRF04-17]
MTTGNLMADCERWCRDNLHRREDSARSGTTLRLVAAPVVAPPAARRGTFLRGPGWPGIPAARTGS